MIVEDEAVIALQLEDDIQQAGHDVVGWAIDTAGALALARDARPDLALVDVHLQDGPTGVELGRRLSGMGCAVLFVTANAKRLPPDLAGAKGVIDKPFTPAALRRGLDRVLGANTAA